MFRNKHERVDLFIDIKGLLQINWIQSTTLNTCWQLNDEQTLVKKTILNGSMLICLLFKTKEVQ